MSSVWKNYAVLAQLTSTSFYNKSDFCEGILPTYEITGKIPRKALAYDKIFEFWFNHIVMRPCTHLVYDMFIIENDIGPPIDHIRNKPLGWLHLYVSRKWLKDFLSPKELTNLIVTRMEESK